MDLLHIKLGSIPCECTHAVPSAVPNLLIMMAPMHVVIPAAKTYGLDVSVAAGTQNFATGALMTTNR